MGAIKEEVKEYKRRKIIASALQLFYEKGYTGTSIEVVAEKLGVSKPYIYTYFENKEALLTAIYEFITDHLVESLDASLSQDASPPEQLAGFVDRFARENMESQTLATVFLQEEKHLDKRLLSRIRAREKTFDNRLTALIQRGIDAKQFDVENASVTALAITGMIRWIHRWYQPGGRMSVDEIARLMSDLALNTVRYRAPRAEAAPARKRVTS